jgi:hypothetical protein
MEHRGDGERTATEVRDRGAGGILGRYLSSRGLSSIDGQGGTPRGQFVIVLAYEHLERIPLTIADCDREEGSETAEGTALK